MACFDKDVDCGLVGESGPCRAAIIRWYYDAYDKKCLEFIYGGCRGNENNFVSKDKCEEKCMESRAVAVETTTPRRTTLPPMLKEECKQNFHQGNCTKLSEIMNPKIRYFYKYPYGCNDFFYCGQGGNDNNFETMQDCKDFCEGEQASTTMSTFQGIGGQGEWVTGPNNATYIPVAHHGDGAPFVPLGDFQCDGNAAAMIASQPFASLPRCEQFCLEQSRDCAAIRVGNDVPGYGEICMVFGGTCLVVPHTGEGEWQYFVPPNKFNN